MSAYNKKPDQYSTPRAARKSPAREVTMPADEWALLDAEVERRGQGASRSSVIREALRKHFGWPEQKSSTEP